MKTSSSHLLPRSSRSHGMRFNSMAELNVDSDSDLEEELSEYNIVELNKLDQSQATLLQSIIHAMQRMIL